MAYTRREKDLILDRVMQEIIPTLRRSYNDVLGVNLEDVDVVKLPETTRSKYPSFAGKDEALCAVTREDEDIFAELDTRTRERYGRSFFGQLIYAEDYEESGKQNTNAIEDLAKRYNLDTTIFVFPDFWSIAKDCSPLFGSLDRFLFYIFGHELVHIYQKQQCYIRPHPFIKEGFAEFTSRHTFGLSFPTLPIDFSSEFSREKLYVEMIFFGIRALSRSVSSGRTLEQMFKQGEYADLDEEVLDDFLNHYGFLTCGERVSSAITRGCRRTVRKVWRE